MDAPVALGSAAYGGFGGGFRVELEVGFGLVEVPGEGNPDHHGNLSGGRADGFIFGAGGVDDGGDVEAVLAQGWPDEAGGSRVVAVILPGLAVVLSVLFWFWSSVGGNDNGPSGWKGGMLQAQVVGLEIDTAEYGGDGEGLAVGQVAGLGDHGELGVGE